MSEPVRTSQPATTGGAWGVSSTFRPTDGAGERDDGHAGDREPATLPADATRPDGCGGGA